MSSLLMLNNRLDRDGEREIIEHIRRNGYISHISIGDMCPNWSKGAGGDGRSEYRIRSNGGGRWRDSDEWEIDLHVPPAPKHKAMF